MELVSEREINEIRGKMKVGQASIIELEKFMKYTETLEGLVEEASMEDFYGTEGWKFKIGWE